MKINHVIDNLIRETRVDVITNDENKEEYKYIEDILNLSSQSIIGKDLDANKDIKVNDKDVIYFETCGRDVCFITADNRLLNLKISMKKLEMVLSNRSYFIKISKNTIINVHHVKEINYYPNMRFQIILTNGYRQIVNRSYFNEFKRCIEEVYK